MRVSDVQTWGVVSVLPNDPVDRAVALMIGHQVSELPVIDIKGHLVGVLTEGHLLRRAELGTEKQRRRWLELFSSPGRLAEEYTRSHTRVVSELMPTGVVTIESEQPLAEAVDLMTTHGIKRIPVTDGDRVVGVLSRARRAARARPHDVARKPRAPRRRGIAVQDRGRGPQNFRSRWGSVEIDVSLGDVTLSARSRTTESAMLFGSPSRTCRAYSRFATTSSGSSPSVM